MSAAFEAYDRLHAEMFEQIPNCLNDARFISDDTDPESVAHLCMFCPLLGPCAAYARAARPAGIWAGRRWAQKRRPDRPSDLVKEGHLDA